MQGMTSELSVFRKPCEDNSGDTVDTVIQRVLWVREVLQTYALSTSRRGDKGAFGR